MFRVAGWLVITAVIGGLACKLAMDAARAGLQALAEEAERHGKVQVGDTWHDPMCLVARYPEPQSDPFPWCTCEWRRARSGV